ncbi:hypothetical protein S83_071325, partial [Arachis hypogaea]
ENASSLEIQDRRYINGSDLGLPNLINEFTTCGAKAFHSVEDAYSYILYSKVSHYGMIKFNVAILHPYFLWEMAQILNKICPACKSFREELPSKVSYVLLLPNITIGNSYPKMKFRVSSNNLFRENAVIIEIKAKKYRGDFWDFIPYDPQQKESRIKPNRRALSPYQIAFSTFTY